MEKNAIIAAVLSIAILVAWQYLVLRPYEERDLERQQAEKARRAAEAKKRAPLPEGRPLPVGPAAPTAPAPAPRAPEAPGAVAAGKEDRVRVDTGVAVFELTNRGAGIVSAKLKGYEDPKGTAIEMAAGSGPALRPLYFEGAGPAPRLNAALYDIEGGDLALGPGRPEGKVRFRFRGADGLAAEKVFSFRHGSHAFGLEVRLENPSGSGPVGLSWGPRVGGSGGNTYGGVIEGPMSYTEKGLVYDYPEQGKPAVHGADLRWTALQTKYFIAALIPRAGAGGAAIRLLAQRDEDKDYAIAVPLARGEKALARFDVYVGPKEVDRMARLGVDLEASLDYGKFGFISRPLMSVLRMMHAVSGNWGVAIILLTILVKLLFYPLTHVSMRNMKEMQKLQPKMEQLREIYKNNKAKMNEEVMALYREHKVNPMMGCLPMIVQIPVFFGLYEALLVSIELRNAPFFWWVTDLSKQDPFHVYTILMGASMFLQQKMTPTAGDPTQAKMMMFMPIIFTGMFIFYPVPVGLVIYWLVNNLLSIGQQYFVNRSVKRPRLAEGN